MADCESMFETCLISLEISTSSYLLCGCFFCLLFHELQVSKARIEIRL